MLNVNANLFRIAALAQSSESTRYYLCGVFVEPHHSGIGVTLTATDGRYLVSIYDESGTTTKSVIIGLPKPTLQSCKPAKRDIEPRRLVISDLGNAFVRLGDGDVGVASKTIVDGTYPDWRRVVKNTMAANGGNAQGFDQKCLRVLCEVSHALTDDNKAGVLIEARGDNAAMVRFDTNIAFGLLTPMRMDVKPNVPWWFATEAASKAA